MKYLIIIAVCCSKLVCAQSADSILIKYFTASGGLEKLRQVNTCRQEKSVWQKSDLTGGGAAVGFGENSVVKCLIKKPHYVHTDLYEQGKLMYTSNQNDREFSFRSIKKDGEPVSFIKERDARWATIQLSVNLAELYGNSSFKYTGKATLDGKSYCIITGPYEPDGKIRIRYFFNSKTGLIDLYERIGDGPLVTVYFDDYRDVDGIKIPYIKYSKNASGFVFNRELTIATQINCPVSLSDFEFTD